MSVKKDFFRCSILVFLPMLYRFILIKNRGHLGDEAKPIVGMADG